MRTFIVGLVAVAATVSFDIARAERECVITPNTTGTNTMCEYVATGPGTLTALKVNPVTVKVTYICYDEFGNPMICTRETITGGGYMTPEKQGQQPIHSEPGDTVTVTARFECAVVLCGNFGLVVAGND